MLKNFYRVLRPEYLNLDNGDKVMLRFLRPDDGPLLHAYLQTLPHRVRRHLMPHPMDPERIAHLCETLDDTNSLRLVAATDNDTRLIGYLVLHVDFSPADLRQFKAAGISVSPTIDCAVRFAISDEYKRLGVTHGLFRKASAIGRMLGRDRTLYWHTYANPITGRPVAAAANLLPMAA